MALGFGACYTITMEVLLGHVPRGAAHLLHGGGSGGPGRTEDYSRLDALVSRGHWDEALGLTEAAIEAAPRRAGPYIRHARVLLARKDYEGAVRTLETGYREARADVGNEEFLVHQIHDVCVGRLGDPERAAHAISDWLDRRPEMDVPEWADNALRELSSETRDTEA